MKLLSVSAGALTEILLEYPVVGAQVIEARGKGDGFDVGTGVFQLGQALFQLEDSAVINKIGACRLFEEP